MSDENLLNKAIEIAVKAHKGQVDKYGHPYIIHVFSVMNAGETMDEKICGALHDVVEDTPWTFNQLRDEGFSEEIISALICVTKKSDDEDYQGFTDRIKTNHLAVNVKINDLQDNMDVRRMTEVKETDAFRLNKYLQAYRQLLPHKFN